ncbi:MAG: glycosyltransferase family 39 protein [Candidatus Curtissbacteria bacterium]
MINVIIKYRYQLLIGVIILVALYLRFWHIDRVVPYTWDQGRDSWVVRDLLRGNFPLRGPRTGVGDFYLGPAYYYLLAPFYFISDLDPIGAQYFNIAANVVTLILLYWVTEKIFSRRTAFAALFLYAFSLHTISGSMIPWNVSLVPALTIAIIFCLYRVLSGNYKYLVAVAALAGFAFHIHFTAVFLPFVILPYLIIATFRGKTKFLKWSLVSLPFFVVWFVPTIVESLITYNDNYYRFVNFLKTFLMGFHARFMFYRLSDSLIQFAAVINFRAIEFIKYIIPLVFIVVAAVDKRPKVKINSLLMATWFLVPLLGFTLYKGHVTDYYYLINLPVVIIILAYLIDKVFSLKMMVLNITMIIGLAVYFLVNTNRFWSKPDTGGLYRQKMDVGAVIDGRERIGYTEGDIKSYLYTIWVEDGRTRR